MSESVNVPKIATLDGFAEAVSENQGMGLEEARAGRTLIVETENSTYTIHILDPVERTVMVTGGTYFPNPETCRLSGATFGGSFIRMGWIGLGMCMEFRRSNNKRIITSLVKTISLPVAPSHQVH